MIKVLERVERRKIQCEKCGSLLEYDKYDELGEKEFEKSKEEFKKMYPELSKFIITPLVDGELYIWCPVCGNKIITTKLFGYKSYELGEPSK